MYCRNCGKQISDQSKFCPKCGSSVAQIESDQPAQLNLNKEAHGRVNNTIPVVLIVLQILIAILMIAFARAVIYCWSYMVPPSDGPDLTPYEIALLVATVGYVITVLLDWKSLSTSGHRGNWKVWGLLVPPIYFYLRAKKLNQKKTLMWISIVGIVLMILSSMPGKILAPIFYPDSPMAEEVMKTAPARMDSDRQAPTLNDNYPMDEVGTTRPTESETVQPTSIRGMDAAPTATVQSARGVDSDYRNEVYDELGWIDTNVVANGIREFYHLLGIQPAIYLENRPDLIGNQQGKAEEAERIFNELGLGPDAFLYVYMDDNGSDGDWMTWVGNDAVTVMDPEAVQIFRDYLNQNWVSDKDDSQMLIDTFNDTAKYIVSHQ